MRAGKFRGQFRRLAESRDGNFAVLGAIAFVPIIAVAGLAIDFAGAYLESEKIQNALDSAALGSVRVYGEGATEAAASEEGEKFFWSNYSLPRENVAEALAQPTDIEVQEALTLTFARGVDEDTATAEFAYEYKPLFLERQPFQIRRQAVAARTPSAEACILALHHTAQRGFEVSGSAIADMTGCVIVSNSNHGESIYAGGTGKLKAECLYAAGGIYGSPQAVTLACEHAVEGSPRVPDPFASKALPKASTWVDLSGCGVNYVSGGGGNGNCNGTGKTPKNTDGYVVTLKPGTYRTFEVKGTVKLEPGYYIIDGGRLELAAQSVVTGRGVTFFLLNGADLLIRGGATFDISPSLDGDWAGFSIVAEHGNTEQAVINGNSSSSLTGIVYLPDAAELQYSGNGLTGGECIRIIAQEITLTGNSTFKMDCSAELADKKLNYPGAIRLVR